MDLRPKEKEIQTWFSLMETNINERVCPMSIQVTMTLLLNNKILFCPSELSNSLRSICLLNGFRELRGSDF